MKWPRMTLRSMMLAIGVIAINGGVIRYCFATHDGRATFALGLMTALNFLLIVSLRRWVKGRWLGPRNAFWKAFLVTGWMCVLLVVAFTILRSDPWRHHVVWVAGSIFLGIVSAIAPAFSTSGPASVALFVLVVVAGVVYMQVWISGPILAAAAFVGSVAHGSAVAKAEARSRAGFAVSKEAKQG